MNESAGVVVLVALFITMAISILQIAAMWKIFTKAGLAGWKCIIPIYSFYCLAKITMGNGMIGLLTLVPFVGVVVVIILNFKLASSFGKGAGFGAGLIFLPIIFCPLLGFGDAQYEGP